MIRPPPFLTIEGQFLSVCTVFNMRPYYGIPLFVRPDPPRTITSHLFPLLLIGHVVTYIVLIKGGASERCDFSQFGKR
jgi:hypothetical protein